MERESHLPGTGMCTRLPDGWDITLEPLDAIEVRRASASEAEEEEPKEREAGTRTVTTKDLDDKAQLNRRR